jgi:hypothetical protein
MVKKVYLLEDCRSPMVLKGFVDYIEQVDRISKRLINAGIHGVQSTLPFAAWTKETEEMFI